MEALLRAWLLPGLSWLAIAVGSGIALWFLCSDRAKGRKRCPRCWYEMTSLQTLTCPECGRAVRSERSLRRTRPRWRPASLGVLIILPGIVGLNWVRLTSFDWIPFLPTRVIIWRAEASADLDGLWWNELRKRFVGSFTDPDSSLIRRPAIRRREAIDHRTELASLFTRTLETGRAGTHETELRHLLADVAMDIAPSRINALADPGLQSPEWQSVWLSLRLYRSLPPSTRRLNLERALTVITPLVLPNRQLRVIDASQDAAMAELAAFLGECDPTDPRVLDGLRQVCSYALMSREPAVSRELRRAAAHLGKPGAELLARLQKSGLVIGNQSFAEYVSRSVAGDFGDHQQVLVSMLVSDDTDDPHRLRNAAFAREELTQALTLSDAALSDLTRAMTAEPHWIRVAAAEVLIQRGALATQARRILDQESAAGDFYAFYHAVHARARLGLPMRPLATRLEQFASDPAASPSTVKKLREIIDHPECVRPDGVPGN